MQRTGFTEACEARTRLLERLNPDGTWQFGLSTDPTVYWFHSYLSTEFSVHSMPESVSNYALLHIRTRLVEVENVDAALEVANNLNQYTSTARWLVLGGDTPELVCDTGFVIGNSNTDLSLDVMTLATSEHIAKSVAIFNEDFCRPWGKLIMRTADNQIREFDTWAPIIEYFNAIVLPDSDNTAERLAAVMKRSFEVERDNQFEKSVPAWFGTLSPEGLVYEVPFGKGNFTSGVISSSATYGEPGCETALITGQSIRHPHLGNGVLLFLQIPISSYASGNRLNYQPLIFTGFNHIIGAWVEQENGTKFSVFIPSSWGDILSDADLIQFFRELHRGMARVAWAAGYELEAHWRENTSPMFGLAAGSSDARGPQYGELAF